MSVISLFGQSGFLYIYYISSWRNLSVIRLVSSWRWNLIHCIFQGITLFFSITVISCFRVSDVCLICRIPEVAEAMPAVEAIRLAAGAGWTHIIIEGEHLPPPG